MTGIPFGAIVLTDFPFTDFTSVKRRPALVVSTGNELATLDTSILAGRIGFADPAWLAEHSSTFFAVFGFSTLRDRPPPWRG